MNVLSLYPTNNTVRLYKKAEIDRWGLTKEDTEGTEYSCVILENTKLQKVPTGQPGKEVVFHATVYFPELVHVKTDDTIEYLDSFGELQKKTVIQVQAKRDFGGNILTVKAYV